MTEQISAAGVPVFAADIKGDLSGIASPGQPNDKLLARTKKIGQDWQPRACPIEFFALGGQGLGVPLRATISSFGPVLLAKVLGLNEVQESSLGLVFHYADQAGLPLLDLKDLRAVLTHLTSDEGKAELKAIGGLSAATVGVILRTLITFSDQGADEFFGEPEFDSADLLRVTRDGQGVVSLLELPNLIDRPAVFSTFLMWLLADLFHELPEVGDVDKPKLVFFFDEAHLLFADASKAFLDAIAQTVRLIRSKGVGIFFVTQTPKDVPDDVLAQLGSRVQHQLRAHTPNDAKALKQTVATFPKSHYDLAETLQQLGIGEAHRDGDGSGRCPDTGGLDPDAGAALLMAPTPRGGAAARHRGLGVDGQVRPGPGPGFRARDIGPQAAGRSRGGGARTPGRRGRAGGRDRAEVEADARARAERGTRATSAADAYVVATRREVGAGAGHRFRRLPRDGAYGGPGDRPQHLRDGSPPPLTVVAPGGVIERHREYATPRDPARRRARGRLGRAGGRCRSADRRGRRARLASGYRPRHNRSRRGRRRRAGDAGVRRVRRVPRLARAARTFGCGQGQGRRLHQSGAEALNT